MITSAVSVNSAVSVSTTSLKKSALKKPKKDVSVSFKKMPDSDTVENEEDSVNINSYDDDSHEESEDFTNKGEEKNNDKHVEENNLENKKMVETKETSGYNTNM